MPRCIPIKEIKNTTEFARIVEESPEPVIVTRNGREAFAAMSIELLDAMRMERARAELYRLLDEAEEASRDGRVVDARDSIKRTRDRYGL
ncbi:type II toxin-antitoxin system prevent-host-death family antitoxin [Thermophilibacter provencensis]|uniref:Antitoxin n=1 Tax=Thermophilibacter provencensis TaxID=1852386 RepID=A0ABT7V1A1_9ACTN|nr:type II toxin-antitoxin system prevent-host-death family antitoxin [Thermophilibacter provencensis]MDM8270389.1 type II toxin-antitoxin system prevent-host-death family antitoxin [Thermophilibacter provencensis]